MVDHGAIARSILLPEAGQVARRFIRNHLAMLLKMLRAGERRTIGSILSLNIWADELYPTSCQRGGVLQACLAAVAEQAGCTPLDAYDLKLKRKPKAGGCRLIEWVEGAERRVGREAAYRSN